MSCFISFCRILGLFCVLVVSSCFLVFVGFFYRIIVDFHGPLVFLGPRLVKVGTYRGHLVRKDPSMLIRVFGTRDKSKSRESKSLTVLRNCTRVKDVAAEAFRPYLLHTLSNSKDLHVLGILRESSKTFMLTTFPNSQYISARFQLQEK